MCLSRSPEEVFNAALVEYANQTGHDLAKHPLSAQLENSKSPSDVLNVIGELAKTFHQSKEGSKSLVKVLEPTVDIVCSLSGAFGNSIGLVRPSEMVCFKIPDWPLSQAYPPASAIFGGVSLLFMVRVSPHIVSSINLVTMVFYYQAAKNASSSHDALFDLFDSIGNVLKCLVVHKRFTPAITEIAVKVLAELLSVLGLATNQIKMGRFSKYHNHMELFAVVQGRLNIRQRSLEGNC